MFIGARLDLQVHLKRVRSVPFRGRHVFVEQTPLQLIMHARTDIEPPAVRLRTWTHPAEYLSLILCKCKALRTVCGAQSESESESESVISGFVGQRHNARLGNDTLKHFDADIEWPTPSSSSSSSSSSRASLQNAAHTHWHFSGTDLEALSA
ncbi:hypothetical protein ACLKA7_011115 [Drosophila subpalustris]